MLFIPVSYSNALIISVIRATATDVRTSAGELRKSQMAQTSSKNTKIAGPKASNFEV